MAGDESLDDVGTDLTDDEAAELLDLFEDFDDDLRDALDRVEADIREEQRLRVTSSAALDVALGRFKAFTDKSREIIETRIVEGEVDDGK